MDQDKDYFIIVVAGGCYFFPIPKPYSMKIGQPEFSIHAFQEGQQGAFTSVFDHYYQALCFFATRLIQDEPAAEDIAQETFIKLWEKHEGFHSPQAIKAFLYITTRNACFNFMRRSQAGQKNHQVWLQGVDGSEDFILNHLVRSEVIREMHRLLEQLPPECGKIMRLSFIEGFSNHEIASMLGISIHTVKNQKARAIYLIKKKLANNPLLRIMVLMLLPGIGSPPSFVVA
jgi:RNA polymerase sigma-70 factor (family 1)